MKNHNTFLIRLILLIVCFCYLSCNKPGESGFLNKKEAKNRFKEGVKEGKWIEYFDNDWEYIKKNSDTAFYRLIRYDNGKPKKGHLVRDYYISGEIQFKGYLKDVEPNAVHDDGLSKWFYKNGKISSSEIYLNGKKNGEIKSYYKNGLLQELSLYKDDKLNGLSKQYYETGKIKTTINYIDGEENGEASLFDEEEDSLLIKRFLFEDGEKIREEIYEEGELFEKKIYLEGEFINKVCFEDGEEIECEDNYDVGDVIKLFLEMEEQLAFLLEIENSSIDVIQSNLQLVKQAYDAVDLLLGSLESNTQNTRSLRDVANYMSRTLDNLTFFLDTANEAKLLSAAFAYENYKNKLASVMMNYLGDEFVSQVVNELMETEEAPIGIITGNRVNMRSSPKIRGNNIIASLEKNENVRVLERYESRNKNEYLCTNKTYFIPKQGNKFIIQTGKAIRLLDKSSPYENHYEVVIDTNKNKTMAGYIDASYLKNIGENYWYKIQNNRGLGWVYGDYVEMN